MLVNFTHTVTSGGLTVRLLQADRAEIFDRRKQTRLSGVYWAEYAAGRQPAVGGQGGQRRVAGGHGRRRASAGTSPCIRYEEKAWIYADEPELGGRRRGC